MRLHRQLLGNRVARRVFGLFLVASVVPVAAFAWLTLDRIGAALEGQAFEQLDHTSRGYGQILLDKLVTVADALDAEFALAEQAAEELPALEAAAVSMEGEVRVLFGDWPAGSVPTAMSSSMATLTVLPGPSRSDVVISQQHGTLAVHGRVARDYLAGTDGLLRAGMEACVFPAGTFTAPIHCSAPLPESTLAALQAEPRSSVRRLSSHHDGEERLISRWELFVPSRFAGDSWVIVVSQPREVALSSLSVLNRVIPLATILIISLILLLSISQIRRTLRPLGALVLATQRISAQDFSTPVTLDGRDEFGALGSALNDMAARLERQFGALSALAAIDQSILRSAAIEPVLDTLFQHLMTLVPHGRHALLLVDADDPLHGRVYRHPHQGAVERVPVTPELTAWLASEPDGQSVSAATLTALGVAWAGSDLPVTVVPMWNAEELVGALLSARADASEVDSNLTSLRELAARVAVAVAAGKREAELIRRAHFDSLTSLPNRQLLNDRLHQAVAQAERERHALSVLFLDLDSFKDVNDTLGHGAGDELLRETALRLTSVVRQADTVARLGGDEYAILLPHVHSPLEAEGVAAKALAVFRQPFAVAGRDVFVGASVGVAMYPDDGNTGPELLRKADVAMYGAKASGRGCYRFFAEQMDRHLQERHVLNRSLRHALANGEFTLAYQPQMDLRASRFVSVEALLRWQHPERGMISPALFVPALEETGLIREVGAWVLHRALADFAEWRRIGLPFQRVAVNVSTRQLFDDDFVDTVLAAVAAAGVSGQELEIELTEASLVEDFRAANAVLTQLREHRIRVALDDFGTGYSSLSYLNELVFDTLKIDRAFIVNLPAPKSAAVARAIVAVAKALGKEVVAEGVETQVQYDELLDMGCTYAQGYLLAKPLAGDELIAWATRMRTAQVIPDSTEPLARRQAGRA